MQKCALTSAHFFVEMAGIEPASERLEPRTSTSVGCRLSCQQAYDSQKDSAGPPLEPESPSFVRLAASRTALRLFVTLLFHRSEIGVEGRGPIRGPDSYLRLGSEGKSGKFSAVCTYVLR